jgi:hypothetical protein
MNPFLIALVIQTIIPVTGSTDFGTGVSKWFSGSILITNPNASSVETRVIARYPRGGVKCDAVKPQIIAARSTSSPSVATCGLEAMLIESDQPVVVNAAVRTFTLGQIPTPRATVEEIPVTNEWLPANRDALIPAVTIDAQTLRTRANLFTVNPNDVVLHVHMHVASPERAATADIDFDVPARSLDVRPIAELDNLHSASLTIVSGIHDLTVRADGKFLCGASSVQENDAAFRLAIPLAP